MRVCVVFSSGAESVLCMFIAKDIGTMKIMINLNCMWSSDCWDKGKELKLLTIDDK